eukprot:scaffold16836_cov48-Phaeocystis_antarctica.AAC.1
MVAARLEAVAGARICPTTEVGAAAAASTRGGSASCTGRSPVRSPAWLATRVVAVGRSSARGASAVSAIAASGVASGLGGAWMRPSRPSRRPMRDCRSSRLTAFAGAADSGAVADDSRLASAPALRTACVASCRCTFNFSSSVANASCKHACIWLTSSGVLAAQRQNASDWWCGAFAIRATTSGSVRRSRAPLDPATFASTGGKPPRMSLTPIGSSAAAWPSRPATTQKSNM